MAYIIFYQNIWVWNIIAYILQKIFGSVFIKIKGNSLDTKNY